MASADFCPLQPRLATVPVSTPDVAGRYPRVRTLTVPPAPVASTPSPLGNQGFVVFRRLTKARAPHMRFVFLRP